MTQKESQLQLIRMADVPLAKVEWLWYPFIPFGKITIIQGDPGEGKTTLALRLAAMCSTGQALPGMDKHPHLVEQAGISRRTLDIAKKNMTDVASKKVGGHWVWMLKS